MQIHGRNNQASADAVNFRLHKAHKPEADFSASALEGNRPLPISRLGTCKAHDVTGLDTTSVALVKSLLFPLAIALSLFGCVVSNGEDVSEKYWFLGGISSLLATHVFGKANLYRRLERFPFLQATGNILIKWAFLAGCLLSVAYVTRIIVQFPQTIVVAWFAVTPFVLLLSLMSTRWLLRNLVGKVATRKSIIVGANTLGYDLYRKISQDAYLGIRVEGFFDDRGSERLPMATRGLILGKIGGVAEYAKEHQIDLIYISLPMIAQQRILRLLDDLGDATSCVYFVPDIFMFDLIQARFDRICDVPLLSVYATPFFGVRTVIKRLCDIGLAALILFGISPLMAVIAVGVKLSSPGPILFKQRRYGLNGEEISVYKFRSMTVCEDDDRVIQAKKGDGRVTSFGRFLRKTSLDELPQFINVLQGSMSIVGPRPHAVAHNELYRKRVRGYMIRHKVKPGITGWAQVNGLRGETDTIDKMCARIAYDLDYIRHWSLSLDLWIMLKTIKVVVGDRNAF